MVTTTARLHAQSVYDVRAELPNANSNSYLDVERSAGETADDSEIKTSLRRFDLLSQYHGQTVSGP